MSRAGPNRSEAFADSRFPPSFPPVAKRSNGAAGAPCRSNRRACRGRCRSAHHVRRGGPWRSGCPSLHDRRAIRDRRASGPIHAHRPSCRRSPARRSALAGRGSAPRMGPPVDLRGSCSASSALPSGGSRYATKATANRTARATIAIFLAFVMCARLLPSVPSHGGGRREKDRSEPEPRGGHLAHPFAARIPSARHRLEPCDP